MRSKEEWIEKDLKYVWHPDTQMKQYEGKDFKPVLIEKGKGIYLYDADGNEYIDGVSSWWVNTLGHSNEKLNKILTEQAEKIEHVLLADFTHRPAIELAEKLIKLAGEPFSKVFYSDDGSTAVEVALKMAYQYWYQKGKPEKKYFVSMTDSYHGDTLGSVSVGGIDIYKKIFSPLVFDTIKVCAPFCYRCPKGQKNPDCKGDGRLFQSPGFRTIPGDERTFHQQVSKRTGRAGTGRKEYILCGTVEFSSACRMWRRKHAGDPDSCLRDWEIPEG